LRRTSAGMETWPCDVSFERGNAMAYITGVRRAGKAGTRQGEWADRMPAATRETHERDSPKRMRPTFQPTRPGVSAALLAVVRPTQCHAKSFRDVHEAEADPEVLP
jgi:hypothetical protein